MVGMGYEAQSLVTQFVDSSPVGGKSRKDAKMLDTVQESGTV